jgi:hypothetical protein
VGKGWGRCVSMQSFPHNSDSGLHQNIVGKADSGTQEAEVGLSLMRMEVSGRV